MADIVECTWPVLMHLMDKSEGFHTTGVKPEASVLKFKFWLRCLIICECGQLLRLSVRNNNGFFFSKPLLDFLSKSISCLLLSKSSVHVN